MIQFMHTKQVGPSVVLGIGVPVVNFKLVWYEGQSFGHPDNPRDCNGLSLLVPVHPNESPTTFVIKGSDGLTVLSKDFSCKEVNRVHHSFQETENFLLSQEALVTDSSHGIPFSMEIPNPKERSGEANRKS